MGLQVLPNIIFLVSVLGLVIMFLRRLPEAAALDQSAPQEVPAELPLAGKGLPAVTASKAWAFIKFWAKKFWNFALEAKDLKPSDMTGYKIRRMFQNSSRTAEAVKAAPIPKNLPVDEQQLEQNLLEAIKTDPKNWSKYDELGKYYFEQQNYQDAKDIYRYLVKHEAGSSEFHARLANCYYRLHEYSRSAECFEKSISLDSSQPNRYYNLGLAYDAAKIYEKSSKAFTQAIALEGSNSKFHYALGDALEKLGKRKEAITEFKKAHRLDPQNLQAFDRLKKLV